MFVGTGSDVGKSVINAGFCRIFKLDGLSPAPFKAQNMSLNSFPTPEGLEIGRAQAVQSEACGIDCRVEMNPVLLKPTGNMDSQIVLNGLPWANKSAKAYFNETDRDFLFNEAMNAFSRLEAEFNPIVVEGAGSISEVNLWKKDITNSILKEIEEDDIIVNLASNEYFSVIDSSLIENKIISPQFKDFKNGKLKIISFYAKKARGLMTRFLIDNDINSSSDIENFNSSGYMFSNDETNNPLEPVFVR